MTDPAELHDPTLDWPENPEDRIVPEPDGSVDPEAEVSNKGEVMVDNPYIGRIVALLSPFIAAATAFIANGVQDIFNFDLNDANLTVFITGAVVAVLGIIYKWLDNRGAYERLVETGTQIQEAGEMYAPSVDPSGDLEPE